MAKTKKKSKPEVEVEEELDEELELDELDEDEVEETKPKSKKSKAADDVTFGAKQLAEYISEKTGKKIDARGIRTLLRKMARDGSGRLEREISPDNRTRYSWSGPNDPQVKLILKAVEDGELEAHKKEQLDKLKADKAKKQAAAGKDKKKGKKAPVVEDDDDDEDEDDDE